MSHSDSHDPFTSPSSPAVQLASSPEDSVKKKTSILETATGFIAGMSIMLLLCQEFPLAMWGAHILETLRPNWGNPSETQKVLMTQYEWFIVLLPGSLWGVLFFAAIVVAIVGNLTKTSRYVMLMWAMTDLTSFFGMAEVVRSVGEYM